MIPLTLETRYGTSVYLTGDAMQFHGGGMSLDLSHDADYQLKRWEEDGHIICLLQYDKTSIHFTPDEYERVTAFLASVPENQWLNDNAHDVDLNKGE
ncbi:hypothetical protein AB4501_25260 [Vibrio sp. 10N.222.55.E8]|uniref:hypothetical protein n=1 Tax=Vibrio artabrorum TaxID=446374 RepID=UPI00336E668B|nr:hypothetical protein VCHA29O37_870006 [Vibrio chagasii]